MITLRLERDSYSVDIVQLPDGTIMLRFAFSRADVHYYTFACAADLLRRLEQW